MIKKVVIVWLLLSCAGAYNLQAQTITDTAAFAKQVIEFFKTNAYPKKAGTDKIIRNSSNPAWYEINSTETFAGFNQPRRRYRKAACYNLNELVFGLDTITDRQLTRDWNRETISNPNLDRLTDLYYNLLTYFEHDSLHVIVDADIIDPKIEKRFNDKAYRSLLYLPDQAFHFYITHRQSAGRILLRIMIQALGGDTYERQLVFAVYEDSCVGL